MTNKFDLMVEEVAKQRLQYLLESKGSTDDFIKNVYSSIKCIDEYENGSIETGYISKVLLEAKIDDNVKVRVSFDKSALDFDYIKYTFYRVLLAVKTHKSKKNNFEIIFEEEQPEV